MGLRDWIGQTGASILIVYVTYTIGYNHGQEDYKIHSKSVLEKRIEKNIDFSADVTKKTFKKINELSKELPDIIDSYLQEEQK